MKKKLLLSVGICIMFMANTLLAQQVLQQLTPQPGQTQIYNVQSTCKFDSNTRTHHFN
jgi:hypothetical protein